MGGSCRYRSLSRVLEHGPCRTLPPNNVAMQDHALFPINPSFPIFLFPQVQVQYSLDSGNRVLNMFRVLTDIPAAVKLAVLIA